MNLVDVACFLVVILAYCLGYVQARDQYKRLLDRSWERERHLHQTMNEWLRAQKAWKRIQDDRDSEDWWKRS